VGSVVSTGTAWRRS